MSAYDVVCHSSDPQWLEERKKGVTASEIGHLLSGKSAMQLWAEKTGRMERDNLDGNDRVWWGSKLEKIILEGYSDERYSGRPTEPSGFLLRSKKHPWLLATLDAWTEHPTWGRIPVDAKNTATDQERKWEDGTPANYFWQIQTQATVCGTPGSSICAFLGGNNLVWADEERHDAHTKQILSTGEMFWWCLKNDVPPSEVDGLASTRQALDAIYPTVSPDKVVHLTEDWAMTADAELENLKAELKAHRAIGREIETKESELKNRIKRAMGDAELARLPNGSAYIRKVITRAVYTATPKPYSTLKRAK